MNLSEVAIDHESNIPDSTPNVSRVAVYSEGRAGPFLLFSTQVETLAI